MIFPWGMVQYTYENAIKRYLPSVKTGKSVVILPTEESMKLGSVVSSGGEYLYTLFLRESVLVNEQNTAYFGKTGVASKIVLSILKYIL